MDGKGVDNGANRDTKLRQAEADQEAGNDVRQGNEEELGTVLDNDEQTVNVMADSLEELADSAGSSNNLTNNNTDGRETETADEGSEFWGELEEQLLGIKTDDGEGSVDDLSGIRKKLAGAVALEVFTERSNDLTDGDGEGREDTGDESSDGGSELDEKSTSVLADHDKETFCNRAQVLQQITDAGGSLDDLANGGTEAGETKAVDESGNLGRELDEQRLGIGPGDGQDLVDERTEVSDDLAGGCIRRDCDGCDACRRSDNSRRQSASSRGGNGRAREEAEGSEGELHCGRERMTGDAVLETCGERVTETWSGRVYSKRKTQRGTDRKQKRNSRWENAHPVSLIYRIQMRIVVVHGIYHAVSIVRYSSCIRYINGSRSVHRVKRPAESPLLES